MTSLAKKTKFIQRERKLTVISFMELIFHKQGALSESSLTELCSDLADHHVYLSKEALNKRLNEKTVQFLKEIFLRLFDQQAHQVFEGIRLATSIPFRCIRILDGTTITLPKSCSAIYPSSVGAGMKYQIEFDYLTGRFQYIEIQPGKAGDCPSGMERLHNVEKNDLILQDLGYFQFDILKNIAKKGAFYVSRAKSDTMFYVDHPSPRYHENGEIMKTYAYERLLLEQEWQNLKRGQTREYPVVYLGKQEKLPSRLIIYRMTEEEQRRQEHRIKRRSQTKSRQIKQKSRDLAGISTFITNLPSEVPVKEVVSLYRYRWQIEIIFKSWKSDLKVDYYREMKLERWECHLYAELIVLILSTLITFQLRAYFWHDKHIILSEQITIREVAKKIRVLWRARDDTEWENTLQKIEKTLMVTGRKNVKEPGPIGWLV